jgi:ATP-dependent DNA ligase
MHSGFIAPQSINELDGPYLLSAHALKFLFLRRLFDGHELTVLFIALGPCGTIDFSVLQNELKGRSTKIVMVAFDLLYLNCHDLRKLPLIQRKALLKKTLADTDIQFSESSEVDGKEMFKHACKTGLEGVVSKAKR